MSKCMLILCWTLVTEFCTSTAKAIDGVPTPDFDDRMLHDKYHVELTENGLIAALRHERSDVRGAVGLRLAESGYKDALASIIAAVSLERLEGTRIILAMAAAQLGAEDGVSALKAMCEDTSWSATLRMVAAQTMLQLGREQCLDAVLSLSPSTNDLQAAVIALSLLPRFRMVSTAQHTKIEERSALFLKSDLAAVRGAASQAMQVFGDPFAKSRLKAALGNETDDGVRKLMTVDLLHGRWQF